MEEKIGIVPEQTPQNLNRQLREIYFAIPQHQRIEVPLGSIEAWEELLKQAQAAKRRVSPEYSIREILKRKLSGFLERSETTPSFQSYMVTLFDSFYKLGRYIRPDQTQEPSYMPPLERAFSRTLDVFVPTSPGVFDPEQARNIEGNLLTFAKERFRTLEGTQPEIAPDREAYRGETEHLQELLPIWEAEFMQRHLVKHETVEESELL